MFSYQDRGLPRGPEKKSAGVVEKQPSLLQIQAAISVGLQDLGMLGLGEVIDLKNVSFPKVKIDEKALEILKSAGLKNISLVAVSFPKAEYAKGPFSLKLERDSASGEDRLNLHSVHWPCDLLLPELVRDDFSACFQTDNKYASNPDILMHPERIGRIGESEHVLLITFDGQKVGCKTIALPLNYQKTIPHQKTSGPRP